VSVSGWRPVEEQRGRGVADVNSQGLASLCCNGMQCSAVQYMKWSVGGESKPEGDGLLSWFGGDAVGWPGTRTVLHVQLQRNRRFKPGHPPTIITATVAVSAHLQTPYPAAHDLPNLIIQPISLRLQPAFPQVPTSHFTSPDPQNYTPTNFSHRSLTPPPPRYVTWLAVLPSVTTCGSCSACTTCVTCCPTSCSLLRT